MENLFYKTFRIVSKRIIRKSSRLFFKKILLNEKFMESRLKELLAVRAMKLNIIFIHSNIILTHVLHWRNDRKFPEIRLHTSRMKHTSMSESITIIKSPAAVELPSWYEKDYTRARINFAHTKKNSNPFYSSSFLWRNLSLKTFIMADENRMKENVIYSYFNYCWKLFF